MVVTSLQAIVREAVFCYHSPEQMLEFNRTYLGPTRAAFDSLDAAGQADLEAEFLRVLHDHNRANGRPSPTTN